jgi:hypothetical protein
MFLAYLYSDFFQQGNLFKGFNFIRGRIPILFVSVLLVGLPSYVRMFITGDFSATAFAKALYSIMDYYLLATLTIPIMLYYILLKPKWSIEMSLIFAALSMSIAVYLRSFADWPLWQDGWMLLVKLNLVAYYGYFNLLAFSLVGVAIGISLRDFKKVNKLNYTMFVIGLMAMLIGILLGGHDHLVEGFRLLFPQLFFHTGVALIIISAMYAITNIKSRRGHFLLTIRGFLGTVGIITLPLYILHGYVIPLKYVFMYFGIPKLVALLTPLVIFFLVVGWLAKTVHKTKAIL